MRKLDEADLVWITLIKHGDIELYRWVEEYLSAISSLNHTNQTISEHGKKKLYETLKDIVKRGNRDLQEELYKLSDVLPTVNPIGDDDFKHLFDDVIVDAEYYVDRRIASPDHYRLYFSGVARTDSPSDATLSQFLSEANEGASGLTKFFIEQIAISETNFLELLQRISRLLMAELNEQQASALMESFAEVLDAGALVNSTGRFFGRPQSWLSANAITKDLAKRGMIYADSVIKAFANGAAIGWLTNVFRSEMFAHGRVDPDRRREQNIIFSSEILDRINPIIVNRYRQMSLAQILETCSPIDILYAWFQAGHEEEVRTFVKKETVDDEDFLDFLLATPNVSSGDVSAITEEGFAKFMNYSSTLERVESLSALETDIGVKAKSVLQLFENGKDWP